MSAKYVFFLQNFGCFRQLSSYPICKMDLVTPLCLPYLKQDHSIKYKTKRGFGQFKMEHFFFSGPKLSGFVFKNLSLFLNSFNDLEMTHVEQHQLFAKESSKELAALQNKFLSDTVSFFIVVL